MSLHLLRGVDRRYDFDVPINTIDAAEAYVREVSKVGWDRLRTWSNRRPTRAPELSGGSVYFVGGPNRNQALFRMPFIEVEDDPKLGYGIVMRLELIRVRQDFVGKVRGWRYLEEKDAPPDMPDSYLQSSTGDDLPPEMQAELKEMGLLT